MSGIPKCPKCKKRTYSLTVVTEEEFCTDVTDGKFSGCAAASIPQPVRAYAECQLCGHEWKIRNARTAQLNSYEEPA